MCGARRPARHAPARPHATCPQQQHVCASRGARQGRVASRVAARGRRGRQARQARQTATEAARGYRVGRANRAGVAAGSARQAGQAASGALAAAHVCGSRRAAGSLVAQGTRSPGRGVRRATSAQASAAPRACATRACGARCVAELGSNPLARSGNPQRGHGPCLWRAARHSAWRAARARPGCTPRPAAVDTRAVEQCRACQPPANPPIRGLRQGDFRRRRRRGRFDEGEEVGRGVGEHGADGGPPRGRNIGATGGRRKFGSGPRLSNPSRAGGTDPHRSSSKPEPCEAKSGQILDHSCTRDEAPVATRIGRTYRRSEGFVEISSTRSPGLASAGNSWGAALGRQGVCMGWARGRVRRVAPPSPAAPHSPLCGRCISGVPQRTDLLCSHTVATIPSPRRRGAAAWGPGPFISVRRQWKSRRRWMWLLWRATLSGAVRRVARVPRVADVDVADVPATGAAVMAGGATHAALAHVKDGPERTRRPSPWRRRNP